MNFHEVRRQLMSLTHKWKYIKNGNISNLDNSKKNKYQRKKK